MLGDGVGNELRRNGAFDKDLFRFVVHFSGTEFHKVWHSVAQSFLSSREGRQQRYLGEWRNGKCLVGNLLVDGNLEFAVAQARVFF